MATRNEAWATYPVRRSARQRLPHMDERYAPGHVETVEEFLVRGGQIQRVAAGVSADRLEWPTLTATLLGERDEDIDRGFAWADVNRNVREAVDADANGSLVFGQEETWA